MDFEQFTDNLFGRIHSSTFISSLLTKCPNCFKSFSTKHKYFSSAYSFVLNEENLVRLCMINSNGPRVEFYTTPYVISLILGVVSCTNVNCLRFHK